MWANVLLYGLAVLTLLTHLAGVFLTLSVVHKSARHRRLWLILTVCPLLLIGQGIAEIRSPDALTTHTVVHALFSLLIAAVMTLAVIFLRSLLRDLSSKSEALEQRSRVDDLTGLLQREAWISAVEREIETAARDGSTISIIEIDVDHFKRVNDTYGHEAGDDTLTRLAKLCQSAVRETDLWGRLGGEEFICALPHADPALAFEIAERLRTSVEQHTFLAGAKPITITISLGLTSVQPTRDMVLDKRGLLKSLIREADDAMYAAKREGRNRCHIFSKTVSL